MESYLISVTLADCCRHIQISADATLYRLHQAILNSVDFEDDHSHEFHMDNKLRKSRDVYVSHRDEPADRSTRQYSLRDLKLRKGYVKVLREYLTEKLESPSDAENYLRCMFDLTMQDVILDDILDHCSEWGYYPDTPKERRKFESLYLELDRHTPKAVYRGHTEVEMGKIMHRESEETQNECSK